MPRRERLLAGVVRAAEEVLRKNRVDHVFVGAIAVIVFGEPRTTRDVDVLARIPGEQAGQLAQDFRRRGFFASEYDLRAAIRERAHCSVEDRRGPLRVDLAPIADSTAIRALRTRVGVRWRGITIPVSAPEHTIVMKLKFGSPQDIEDALGILAEQWDRLEFAEMRAFARSQRVVGSLGELVRRVKVPGKDSGGSLSKYASVKKVKASLDRAREVEH